MIYYDRWYVHYVDNSGKTGKLRFLVPFPSLLYPETPIDIISLQHLCRIKEFLDQTQDGPIELRDAAGNFLKYLIENETVYSLTINLRYDVGGLETYKECLKAFGRKTQ